MEIKTQKKYILYLVLELSGYSLLLPFLLLLIGAETWMLLIPIFLVIVWLRIKRTFTKSLRVDGAYLEITYMKYFREKKIRVKTSNTVLILRDYYDVIIKSRSSSRLSWFSMLDIVENNKVKYQLTTKEGYAKDTIMNFFHAFSIEKAGAKHNN